MDKGAERAAPTGQQILCSVVRFGANPWIQIVETRGFDAARRVIADLHAGKADPQQGHVVRLS